MINSTMKEISLSRFSRLRGSGDCIENSGTKVSILTSDKWLPTGLEPRRAEAVEMGASVGESRKKRIRWRNETSGQGKDYQDTEEKMLFNGARAQSADITLGDRLTM